MFLEFLFTLEGVLEKVRKFLITVFMKLNETNARKLTFYEYLHAFAVSNYRKLDNDFRSIVNI